VTRVSSDSASSSGWIRRAASGRSELASTAAPYSPTGGDRESGSCSRSMALTRGERQNQPKVRYTLKGGRS
jgi:hypothetical protein